MRSKSLFLIALISMALSACGDSSQSGTTGSTEPPVLRIEADPTGRIAYTSRRETVRAGEVTVKFKNPQGLPHDVLIANSHHRAVAETPLVARGSNSTTVNLRPGRYAYYSSVEGERQAGMRGVLIVK